MEGKEYLEEIKEGQRKLNEAISPLADKLCEHYDTDRKVELIKDKTNDK